MNQATSQALVRLYLLLTGPRRRNERGDVPGWVMVTVMTVGLAIAIFSFAQEPLKALLNRAFDSVQ